MLIKSYNNWLDYEDHRQLWLSTVCQRNWGFGQKSDDHTQFPMWVQHWFSTWDLKYLPDAPEALINCGNKFVEEVIPEDYKLIRIMISGNTFGQDGDIHTDWPILDQSITGVLYLNLQWKDEWGGETVVYGSEGEIEISKFETGKLIVFDGANKHIGKGPQRECGELRSIVAMQAVQQDVWKEHLDNIKNKK